MVRTRPFEEHPLLYEDWFERNRFVYDSEVLAVRTQLPESGSSVEIGVGSGRFAAPLGRTCGATAATVRRAISRAEIASSSV